MPTLNVPGGLLNFSVFWCDAAPGGITPEPGLVLLAFDRPLPVNCLLAVIGTRDHLNLDCLYLSGLSRASRTRMHMVPVPAEWNQFELRILSLGEASQLDQVELKFDRTTNAFGGPQLAALSVFLQDGRLYLEQPSSARGNTAVALQLYQRSDAAGVFGPASRLADARNPAYQIHTQPAGRGSRDVPSALKQGSNTNRPFTLFVTANTREAAGALRDTRLWHAPLALLGTDRSTLGIFENRQPRGFRAIDPANSTPRSRSFAVPGAAPGDILGLTTGLGECMITIGQGPSESRITVGPCAVFEIDRNGALGILQLANVTPSIMPLGANAAPLAKEIEYQLESISIKWNGARIETTRLAQAVTGGASGAALAELASRAASPAIFAMTHALLTNLLEACPDDAVAADIEAIVDPRRPSLLNRLSSCALGLAIEHEDIRRSLRRQAAGNFDPWSGPDGLRAIFEALFNRPAAHIGDLPFGPDDWYARTTDPLVRIAILAMAVGKPRGLDEEFKVARRIIGAGLQPEPFGTADIDALLALGEGYLVGPPPDAALLDALVWATDELENGPGYDPSLTGIQSRLREAREDIVSRHSEIVSLHDLRGWREAVQFDEIAARLADIRDLLKKTSGGTTYAIPRFDREQAPFNGGFDKVSLVARLEKTDAPEAWKALMRSASESSKWPNAATAALLATLQAMEHAAPGLADPTRRRHRDAEEDIKNARLLFDPGIETSGLLLELRQHAQQEFVQRESDLLARADGEVDSERRDVIRDNARQAAMLSATKELTGRIESVIRDIGQHFEEFRTAFKQTDALLRNLDVEARQRAAKQLDAISDEFVQLRNGFVHGILIRLKRAKRAPREEMFLDIPAIEADIRSATETSHAVQELLFLLRKLASENN